MVIVLPLKSHVCRDVISLFVRCTNYTQGRLVHIGDQGGLLGRQFLAAILGPPLVTPEASRSCVLREVHRVCLRPYGNHIEHLFRNTVNLLLKRVLRGCVT
jgi:hypothetical protein